MGRGSSGRRSGISAPRSVTPPTPTAPAVPNWREAFSPDWDYQRSRDVDHVSRTVTQKLQQRWDAFSQAYQSGVTAQDINNIMKDFDWRTGNLYGYVRTSNSFRINELLYDPANANRTDAQIFNRRDRQGVLRDLRTVQTMDKLINGHKTANDATYTRFASANAIKSLYGLNDTQMATLTGARSMNQSQLDALSNTMAGRTGYSRAYTSTSANRSMNAFGNVNARHSRGMIFERKLYVPSGTNAYAVQRNAQESEVIFGRNANTRLMKVTVASDGHIVLHEMFTGYKKH